ncbi:radical SAM protein, partial [Planctomycetota bacterium]
MNQALCNECKTLCDATVEERGGEIFLVKACPDCGPNETLISGDARRYLDKRGLDAGYPGQVCKLNCTVCHHKQHPTLIFIDITNRCNLNCPICINSTPAMGYVFEPPLDYFQKIFAHFAAYEPRPAIQLFGGEPTVHKGLFEIIRMCKEAGLAPRVVTNGIKLADEDYCRRLIETRATILIAYDGQNRALYRKVRNSEDALDKKLQAIENLRAIGGAKVTFMTLVARGWNDAELPEIFAFAHECRDVVRAIYLMPLAHTWDDETFDLATDRITTEDVENMVDGAFPDDRIDFMPASFLGSLDAMLKCLGVKPLPFVGAHPNCESMYILLSDGESFLAWGRYLKTSTKECCLALQEVNDRLAKLMPPDGRKPGFWLRLRAMGMLYGVLRRHVW